MDTETSSPLPGMYPGTKPVGSVATGNAGTAPTGLPRVPDVKSSVIPHGGNSGGKPRRDGLVPGSAAAKEVDRLKEVERGRKRREAESNAKILAGTAPTLPPVATSPTGPSGPQSMPLGSAPVNAAIDWLPEDFNQVAIDLVEISDAWNVQRKTKKAVEGKLSPNTVQQIAKDASFPEASKRSLSTASPASLAKLFNSLKVPLALKSIITFCPAMAYIILRDIQLDAKIDKLIADEAAKTTQPK